jgi:hypothetical protein
MTSPSATENEALERQIASFRQRLRVFPPVHNRNSHEHEATAQLFKDYAITWLAMLNSDDSGDEECQHILYTLLWCSKDIAHPFSDQVWARLGIDPEALRAQLQEIVRLNVNLATDKDAANAFAIKCKGVGVSLTDH